MVKGYPAKKGEWCEITCLNAHYPSFYLISLVINVVSSHGTERHSCIPVHHSFKRVDIKKVWRKSLVYR